MRKWVIIYDIADDRRLVKVAKLMENYGVRVQKSVFEAVADLPTIQKLRSEVLAIINPEEDSVIYFDICSSDWQKQMKFGPTEPAVEIEDYDII
jgi:CRISPR-associated protein Cas2